MKLKNTTFNKNNYNFKEKRSCNKNVKPLKIKSFQKRMTIDYFVRATIINVKHVIRMGFILRINISVKINYASLII